MKTAQLSRPSVSEMSSSSVVGALGGGVCNVL